MHNNVHVSAIIPAKNESLNIGCVVQGLSSLRKQNGHALIDDIVVCDNGSTDDTAQIAAELGAKVVFEAKPGYGAACLRAIEAAGSSEVYLFVDGDNSVNYSEVRALLEALEDGADMVIGTRVNRLRESGAMTLPQRFGNWIAVKLIKQLWGHKLTDLGPFRAIRASAYHSLGMQDEAFGWTVEMQVKAIQMGLSTTEVAVSCYCRQGVSKISGTAVGVVNAARGILGTIAELWFQEKRTALTAKYKTLV